MSHHRPTRGSGERRKLPQRAGPGRIWIYAYFWSERSHLEHHFQYFERRRAPPNVAGPGKTFPPSPFPLSTGLLARLNLLKQTITKRRTTIGFGRDLRKQWTEKMIRWHDGRRAQNRFNHAASLHIRQTSLTSLVRQEFAARRHCPVHLCTLNICHARAVNLPNI